MATPISAVTALWNNVATAFSAIKMNVTDTASAAASKLLNLQVGGATLFAVGKSGDVQQFKGDRVFYSIDVTDKDAAAPDFNLGISSFQGANLPGSATANSVAVLGWNVDAIGARVDPTRPTLALHWESNYWPNGAAPAGSEFHLISVDTAGTGRRPLTFFLPHDGGDGSGAAINVDYLTLADYDQNQRIKFDWTSGAGSIAVPGAVQIAYGVNNYAPMVQRNGANSAYLALPYFNAEDRLQYAGPGQMSGSTPTGGTYANIFMVMAPGTMPNNGTGLYFQLPAMTGDVFVNNFAGSTTATMYSRFFNANNTNAGSHMTMAISTGGSSGGDPKILLGVEGGGSFSVGIDNSDSDKFKISSGGSLGTTDRLVIDSSGNVGIGTASPAVLLDVNDDSIRVRTSQTPASASATGNAGEIAWDSSYIYVCTATNTWKRVAIATW